MLLKASFTEIDDLDKKILQNLSVGVESYQQLAKTCNITRNKLYRRIASLENRGIINLAKNEKVASQDNFSGILLEAINQTLSSLGKSRKRKVYSYLEKELGIKRKEVLFRISEFSRAIEKVLGTDAFNYKTKLLIEVDKKLNAIDRPKNFDCLVPNLTFEDYIQIKQLLYLMTQNASNRIPRAKSRTPILTVAPT